MKGNEQADKHNSGAPGVISKETIYLDFKERNINLLFGPLIMPEIRRRRQARDKLIRIMGTKKRGTKAN